MANISQIVRVHMILGVSNDGADPLWNGEGPRLWTAPSIRAAGDIR